MLRVRYGLFQPELERSFVEHLRALSAEHPFGPVAVVAPSRRLADRLERVAAVEGGLALLGVHFHTFHSLAVSVVEESGGPDRRLVADPLFHDKLVDLLIEESPAAAGVFGGRGRPRALARAVRASLRDLIDAGVSAESLEEHFGTELVEHPRERERLMTLLELARRYEDRLEKLGVLSPSGLTRLAAGRVEESAYLRSFKEILYYGFYDLTGLQLDFFEEVVSRHPATLYFPYRGNHPAFRFAQPFFEEKLAACEARELEARRPGGAVGAAFDRLFSPSAPAALSAAPPALRVISVSGSRDEVWAAAKEILSLVESGDFRFEDIGLVARTLEPYRADIAQIFRENAIPCAISAGEPLLRHPLAKAALNLLKMRDSDFPAPLVEDIVSSPYFKGGAGWSRRRLHHWRQAVEFLGIHAGWLQWCGKLEGRLDDDLALRPEGERQGEAGARLPREDLRALWELVSGWHGQLGRPFKTWSALARHCRGLLESQLSLPKGAGADETSAWAAVLEALESMEVFDTLGRPPSWDEFLEMLEEKLDRSTLQSPPEPRGVRVLDAMAARGDSFKVLILIGLKEKLFPRQVREDPLLGEQARRALRHPAGYWIARKSSGYEEERLLFALAVASAQERLVCVTPRSDESGKAEVPSLYLRELCRAAGVSMTDERFALRLPRQPRPRLAAQPPERLTARELSLRLTLEGRPASFGRGLPEFDAPHFEACLERLEPLNAVGGAGPMDGLVGPPREHLKELLGRGISPSALDLFERCPFQYFADRVLGLGRREEAAEKGEFAAWARGSLYHAVLERFYSSLGKSFWEDPGAPWGQELDAALESVFRENGWRRLGLYPVLWLAAKQAMGRALRGFAAWDIAELRASGFRPAWLERPLRAPLPAPKELEGLSMRGRIDRLDLDASGGRYRVVDYKTRWKKAGALSGLIAKGELNQLPLYAEMAAGQLGEKAALDSARIYALEDSPETTGRPRSHVYEGDSWRGDRGAFFERVAAAIEEIARGRFPIRPADGEFGHCRTCDFAGLCRKGHLPSRRRARRAS